MNQNQKRKFTFLRSVLKQMWLKSCRHRKRVFEQNKLWLSKLETFNEAPKQKTGKKGRPSKPFVKSSARSKLRKSNNSTSDLPFEQILYAAATSATKSGHRDVGAIVKSLAESPQTAGQVKHSMNLKNGVEKYSTTEALARSMQKWILKEPVYRYTFI